MEDKEKLQDSILGKMKGVLDGNQFLQLNQVLCTEMYDYNVEKIIRDLRKPSGVPRVHCHLFRATYATDLSLKGVSLELIAKLLGHTNLDCLDRYVLNGEDKIEAELKRVGSVA